MHAIRRGLDALYTAAGVIAALCLIAILLLIVSQMLARWTGAIFPGATAYVGYFMAAASFFAFASALARGSHIRVSILLNAVRPGIRRILDAWCFAVAAVIVWYFVIEAWEFVGWSLKFQEVSQSQDKTLLWIPQSVMIAGGGLLGIALTDNLLHVLFAGESRVTRDLVDQSHGE